VHSAEEVSYIIIEAGRHQLADGAIFEAGKTQATHQWKQVSFSPTSDQRPVSAPLTLTQVQTYANSQAVVTRVRSLTDSGFQVRLQEEEGNDGLHTRETVGYLAISPGK